MITPKSEADNSNLDKLFNLFDVYHEEVFNLFEQTHKDISPQLITEFRQEPRVRRWPGDYPNGQLPFDTEKQHRWYWANIGQPYTRSGQMAKGLRQDLIREGKIIKIQASYPSKSAKFVLGNILGEKVERFQQRFHKATGWQERGPMLERHAQTYVDRFARRYESFIAFY